MENREIREHPLGIPVLGDVLVFQSLADLKTKRVPVDQFIPAPITANFTWTSQKATAGDYDTNVIVEHEGNLYKSTIDNNTNTPGTHVSWTLLTRGKSGFTMWAAGTFIEDEVFTLFEMGSAIYVFRLASITRPYESTNFSTEYAAGDWELLGRIQSIEVDTTLVSDIVTFNCLGLQRINFYESDQINEPKTFAFSNLVEGLHSFSRISFDDLHAITFPAGTKMVSPSNASWEALVWTPLDAGDYEMEVTFINAELVVKIHGPLV